MGFCLPKEFASKFLQALKEGKIDPEKMIEMSSEERRSFLVKIVGEADAKEVNALLESKLLLKDQKRGMVSWAKKVSGITEPARRNLISRIEKMDRILDAKDERAFLEDLAAKKLGTDVTFEEAKKISELSNQLTEAKANLTEENRLDYGEKLVALQEYVKELKAPVTSFASIKADIQAAPVSTAVKGVGQIAGTAKSFKASLDNSFFGRQALRVLFTNPVLWGRNFFKSFGDIKRQLGAKGTDNTVMNAIKAEVYSRPNAVNGTYERMKLDIGLTSEEAYPTNLLERIPLLGRLYKASEVAFNGAGIRLRADIADKLIENAKRDGVDVNDPYQARSLGILINSLTGRGDLGRLNQVGDVINVPLFSPRMMKSQFDFLTLHAADKMSFYARKQAAYNTLKVLAGLTSVMSIANALMPGSVEMDSRSSDFGKIRVGNTRFDITGGIASMAVLASRIVMHSTKSSVSKKITPLDSGKFGAPTTMDVIWNFGENKFSPALTALKEIASRTDYDGNRLTAEKLISDLFMPLPIANIQQTLDQKNAAPLIVVGLADFAGLSANTYGKKPK